MKTLINLVLGLLAMCAVAVCAMPAEAHGPVGFRRNNFNNNFNNFHHQNGFNNFNAFNGFNGHHYYNNALGFRGYSVPFVYAPAAFYAPPVVTYVQPAPAVSYSSYSAYSAGGYGGGYGGGGYNAQAYSGPGGGQVYILPDGRTVLPNGVVVQPQ